MKKLLVGIVFVGLAGIAAAQGRVLAGGHYSATVKGLTCASCAPKFEVAMKEVPGIAGALVNPQNGQILFVVKAGAKVEVSALQKKLVDLGSKMGMGLNYSLQEITRLKAD